MPLADRPARAAVHPVLAADCAVVAAGPCGPVRLAAAAATALAVPLTGSAGLALGIPRGWAPTWLSVGLYPAARVRLGGARREVWGSGAWVWVFG